MAKKNSTQWITVNELTLDPTYQRAIDKGFVNRCVKNFNPEAVGHLVVSRRSDGTVVVVDGQHRTEIMKRVGWGDQRVECQVHDNLTVEQEAALFDLLNTKRSVTPTDRFRARLVAGDPASNDIAAIVERSGLAVPQVRAVGVLQNIYGSNGSSNPALLERTLGVTTGAWGPTDDAVMGPVMNGVAAVLGRYDNLDDAKLTSRLAKSPGGAPALLGAARAMKGVRFGTMRDCVASVIVDRYNVGLRSGALPAWTTKAPVAA